MKAAPAQKKPKMSKNPKAKKKPSMFRQFAVWYDNLPGIVKDGINQSLMNAATLDYRAGPQGNRMSARARAQNKPRPLSTQRGFVDVNGRFLNPMQTQKALAKPPGKVDVPPKKTAAAPAGTPRSQNVRQRTVMVPIGTQATDDLSPVMVPERVKYGNGGLGTSRVDGDLQPVIVSARRVGSRQGVADAVSNRTAATRAGAAKTATATRAGTRSTGVLAGGISLDPFIRDILRLATTRTSPARQQVGTAIPLVPSLTRQPTQPLTQFQPATRTKTDTCECDKPKKKRQPRPPRSECWTGTYTQRGKGISYRRRAMVPCS
jgi:hypothetical protein